MATPLVIKVFRGSELVRTEQFNREIIKIGRLSTAHLVLDDERVSRIHSVIEVSPEGAISILDMGSAEGTFVNGKKVIRGVLRPGDQITLGGLRIVVEGALATEPRNVAVAAPVVSKAARTNGQANGAPNGHGHAGDAAPTPAPVAARAEPTPEPEPASAAAADPAAAAPAKVRKPARRAAKPRAFHLQPAERTREDLTGAADLGVELRLLWGGTLLEAATFVKPRDPVLVGPGRACALRVEGLPQGDFPMLRFANGDYQFAFANGMTGVLEEKGGRTPFGELVKSRRAATDEKVKGAWWIPVPRAGAVRAELGGALAVEARPRRPEPVRSPPIWERLNYQLLNLFLVLFFIQSGFIVAANNFPYGTDVQADDLVRNQQTFQKVINIVNEVKQQQRAKADQLAASDGKKDEPGEMAEKHKGEEGQMGKKDAPKTNARSAPRAIDPNAKEVVKRTGLLGALGRGGGGLSTVFGTGGLGGDLKGAVGNMFGPVVGDSGGLGGLGIRGSGTGGGGSGETIGIGAVGTKGRGGGLGSYGTGVGGLGKKGERDVAISTGTAQVMGSIDKELVRKVIQDHAAQIRYCYEQQLTLNPRLAGKVSIKWVINADGSASSAQIDPSATTLENDQVHQCMMSRIQSWQFPKPMGGGIAVITYPWILRSAGGE